MKFGEKKSWHWNGLFVFPFQFLDISGNRLREMSENGILNSLRKAKFLRSLYLYENPWRCNCHLRWLKNFVDTQRITYEQVSGWNCSLSLTLPHRYPEIQQWPCVIPPVCRGVLEGVAGVAMATPVKTQKIERKRERERKKERKRKRKRKKNRCFIFLLFWFATT